LFSVTIAHDLLSGSFILVIVGSKILPLSTVINRPGKKLYSSTISFVGIMSIFLFSPEIKTILFVGLFKSFPAIPNDFDQALPIKPFSVSSI
jgi:hypothetical protein